MRADVRARWRRRRLPYTMKRSRLLFVLPGLMLLTALAPEAVLSLLPFVPGNQISVA